MKKEYIINSKKLINSGLSPNYFLFLQALFEKDESMIEYLSNHKYIDIPYIINILQSENYIEILDMYIDIDFDDIVLLDKAKCLFIDPKSNKIIEDVSNWYQDYRKLFNGTKPGAMGDKKATLKKLQKFVKENPEYSVKDIFNITKKYIDSFQGDYKYLQQADYFIYKEDVNKIVRSRLLTMLEENSSNFEPRQDEFRKDA